MENQQPCVWATSKKLWDSFLNDPELGLVLEEASRSEDPEQNALPADVVWQTEAGHTHLADNEKSDKAPGIGSIDDGSVEASVDCSADDQRADDDSAIFDDNVSNTTSLDQSLDAPEHTMGARLRAYETPVTDEILRQSIR